MVKPSREQALTPGIILEIFSDKGQDKSLVSSNYSDITLDATLNYISKMLMEEDVEEKISLFYEESAVRAMEKPFYDLLGKNYPKTVNKSEILEPPHASSSSVVHKFSLQLSSGDLVSIPASQFNKGVEEGMKFLPSIDKLIVNFTANNLAVASTCEQDDDLVRIDSDGEVEGKDEAFKRFGSRGKKKSNIDNLDHLEGRNRKVNVLSSEETTRRNALFDEVLLERDNYMQEVSKLREVQKEESTFSENDQGEIDDIKNLLTRCCDAVYTNDHQLAKELIKQIRNRSCLDGNGIQRMAFWFAEALEARLTGTGGEAWRRIHRKRIATSEYAKVAQLHMSVCPFPRISIYCSNRIILNAAKKASVLHIVDFGIGLGFQWPSLIHAMSNPNRKTIKLRITGIDFPRPGFRPAELVEETGRRLEDYARSFNVPFEYRGIASKNWEAISLDDLNNKKDEVLIVNCLYRLRDLGDEAVSLDSPRDRLLNLIYQMRPHIFIHGILNLHSFSPFFITRFKQCLTLYIPLFEIYDILVPRDNKQRQMIEREILGKDILNLIACEGSDQTMKPESYKQWHQRNLRAGFEQVPLDPAIVKECHEYLSKLYKNKIFFIEEEGNWFLQGWSGRALDALSTWKPKFV